METIAESPEKHRQMTSGPHPNSTPITAVRSLSATDVQYTVPPPRTSFGDWATPTYAVLDRQPPRDTHPHPHSHPNGGPAAGPSSVPAPSPASAPVPASTSTSAPASTVGAAIAAAGGAGGGPPQPQRLSSHSPRLQDTTNAAAAAAAAAAVTHSAVQPPPPDAPIARADSLPTPSASSSAVNPSRYYAPIYRPWGDAPRDNGARLPDAPPPNAANGYTNGMRPAHHQHQHQQQQQQQQQQHPYPGFPPSGPPPPPQVIQAPPPQMTPGTYPTGPAVPAGGMQYDHNGYMFSQAMSLRQPRRTTRAQQACEQCRSRKAKCDEGRPSCSHCKENNVQCVYKDAPPHKLERSTQLILDKLQNMQEQINTALKKEDNAPGEDQKSPLDLVQSTIQRLPDQIAESLTQGIVDKLFHRLEEQLGSAQSPTRRTRIKTHHDSDDTFASLPAAPTRSAAEEAACESFNQYSQQYKYDIPHTSTIPDDKQPSIPHEHTTAAHKLLMWPAIQGLVGSQVRQDYVMELEEARGPLRPYGRGEGDSTASAENLYFNCSDGSLAGSPVLWEGGHYYIHNPSASKPFSYGYCDSFGLGSPLVIDKAVPEPVGLRDLCTLNVHEQMAWRHHQSYLDNIHILHPILEEESLRRLVNDFIRNYSRSYTNASPNGMGAVLPVNEMRRPYKRRRSDNGVENMPPEWAPQERTAANTIHRSIENSIVLLVLALGAICSWKDELPGFVQDNCSQSNFDHNSDAHHSFSPGNATRDNSHHQQHAPDDNAAMPRNLDNIPGMAYYAFACDILSSHEGRTDLPYAQACILAGLYAGQVAYPFTSHAWLSQASRACQMLVRTSKYSSLPEDSLHKHLIGFAFWTCQQLESDILAELDLPHSGLSRYESKVKYPDFLRVHNISGGPESRRGQIFVLYLTQIVLRNVLNGTHTHLYKADDENDGKEIPHSKVSALLHFRKPLSINLETWRQSLPPLLQWNDGDPPSDDINIARMRAKYYGARYIIHRPLLHHALHSFSEGSEHPSAATSPSSVNSATGVPSPRLSARLISQIKAMDSTGTEPWTGSFGSTNCDEDDQDIQTIQACCICIDSAFHSTTAFDGVKGRPIVTNIFGTAHAQFGNMLVLSAAYNSPLRPLVDGDKLLALFDRTIKFLSQNRYISPSLRRDADILSSIKRKMFDKRSPRYDTPI